MSWKVTHDKWLQVEADRVEPIVLMPRFWHRSWTAQSFKAALEKIGLKYSMPEIVELNDELHERGVVEDVED